MKTLLILHGRWGNSNSNWFPWLKNETEFKSDAVYLPNLPNTNYPVLDEQMDYINVYSSDFSDWWNIVGHSLWCKLALKFVEENNIKNSIIVLVAPVYPWLASDFWRERVWDSYDALDKYFNIEIDFKKNK